MSCEPEHQPFPANLRDFTDAQLLGVALASADHDNAVTAGIEHACQDLEALSGHHDIPDSVGDVVWHIVCRLRVIAELARRQAAEAKEQTGR